MEELLQLKKAKYSIGLKGIVYPDLGLLEDEELVETRKVTKENFWLPLTEYKLTASGIRKKNTRTSRDTTTLPGNIQLN
jgi:DNA-binding PadR family transcriptional regulator